MNWFPYKKVVIESEMSSEEFLNEFKKITLEEDFCSRMSENFRAKDDCFFIGYVRNEKLKYRLLYKIGDLYALSNIKKLKNKIHIELVFKVSFYNKAFSSLWFISISFFTIFAVLEEGFVFFLLLILSFIPFIFFQFQFRTKVIKKMTEKLLEISEGKIINSKLK